MRGLAPGGNLEELEVLERWGLAPGSSLEELEALWAARKELMGR